ncbi:MAG: alanine--tRNA ligase, partial [Lentisphaeria bacterium]|nr:alanine--tRNA ligase [Lentisphaeria bacterium]
EAHDLWTGLGFSDGRIAKLGKKDNWWGPAGATGPCGPDTEIFYWVGELPAPKDFDSENPQWVEIWNNVFMQYNKQADGTFELLDKPNVDTGMGLERITAVLNGKKSVYETEIFAPMFEKLNELVDEKIDCYNRSARVIVEHLRAATIILGDGVVPGNVDQSYVLRRIIRRAINEGRKLGLSGLWISELVKVAITECGDFFVKLITNQATILEEVRIEEEQFIQTLEKGIKEFNKMIASIPPHIENKVVGGRKAFNLYETYGFPVELTQELAADVGFKVDMKGYDKAYKKHQELSRKGAEKKFKGGLADDSVQTAHLHTATHLLHQALKNVLGDHVEQKGSNITSERLRFDFTHADKVPREVLDEVERLVNEQIQQAAVITCDSMTVEDAKGQGAIGLFEAKYGDLVKVYRMGEFSMEICGGPHANNLGELGIFKIKKEQSSSRGVRRIKAVLLDK